MKVFDEDERERRVLGLIWKFTIVKSIASVLPCIYLKTSQELRMLSNVTLNCQVAKIVMNSGSQLSEL